MFVGMEMESVWCAAQGWLTQAWGRGGGLACLQVGGWENGCSRTERGAGGYGAKDTAEGPREGV